MSENVPMPIVEVITTSDVPNLLEQIRPAWQARNLIDRVKRLLRVDPSSACQRLLNAAIHDLREKVVIAGIDIATDSAKKHRLPPIYGSEDIEAYSTSKLIDLAYRMGLLTRPEWRRMSRCYEIRRDLEHEDDEYEAGVEDCVYIFKTCIEVILSRDPIHLLKVTDVKSGIEQSSPATPTESLLCDFERAPKPRQEEILKMLMSIALDEFQSDIVRQNAYTFTLRLSPLVQNSVRLDLAKHFHYTVERKGLDHAHARVAHAMGVLPYLRQPMLIDFFNEIYQQMVKVGHEWRAYKQHGELLRSYDEVGGLSATPPEIRGRVLKWMALAYIGNPGGTTSYGNTRNVYYSNTAAPLVAEMVKSNAPLIGEALRDLAEDSDVKRRLTNQHLSRRYEQLLDLVEVNSSKWVGDSVPVQISNN